MVPLYETSMFSSLCRIYSGVLYLEMCYRFPFVMFLNFVYYVTLSFLPCF